MAESANALSRGLTVLMSVACGAAVANIYYNQPLLGEMARSLHATEQQIGIVPTMTQVGYALGLLFLAPLGDQLERRRLVVVMTLLLAACLVGAAVAPNVAALGVASLLVGCLSTIAQQIIPFVAQLAPPAQRGKVVGNVMSGLLLGVLLARTVSGAIGSMFNWRVVFALAAAGMVLLAVVLRRKLPKSEPAVSLSYPQLMASLFGLMKTQPVLREASWAGGLLFGAFSAFWSTLTLYLESPAYHFGPGVAGLFGLVGMVGALAAPVVGRLSDKGGPRQVVVFAVVATLVSFVIYGSAGHLLAGLIVGVILMDLGVQANQIANQQRVFALIPEARSRLNSCYMVSYFIGGAVGSSLGNFAWTHGGWTAVSSVGTVLCACALLVMLRGKGKTAG